MWSRAKASRYVSNKNQSYTCHCFSDYELIKMGKKWFSSAAPKQFLRFVFSSSSGFICTRLSQASFLIDSTKLIPIQAFPRTTSSIPVPCQRTQTSNLVQTTSSTRIIGIDWPISSTSRHIRCETPSTATSLSTSTNQRNSTPTTRFILFSIFYNLYIDCSCMRFFHFL